MEYTLEKLEVYQLAESFSDIIWNTVHDWNFFLKDTIGKQIVRSADSVSANIAEGYARWYYKDSKQFFFYSRGSLLETKAWLTKCMRRKIMAAAEAKKLLDQAENIHLKLNAYIKFIAKSAAHNKK